MNTFLKIGIGLGFVGVTMLIVLGIRFAYLEHMKCLDNGGHFEDRNCHEVHGETCQTFDTSGNGMTICYPTTYTQCDSVCIGASSEAR